MPAQKKGLGFNTTADNIPEILVYGFIDSDMAKEFAQQIAMLENSYSVINCRINSIGGSVYDGIAMFNTARNAKCSIDMFIDGIAASMASVFPMAGRKIYMSKYARMMTHKPSVFAEGNADELRNVADETDALETILSDMYCQRTGLTMDAVKLKFLNGKDKFFSAKEAKEAKLIDDTYDGPQVNLPEGHDIKAVYSAFETVLNKNSNMKQIPLSVWAQLSALIGITDAADDAAIVASVKTLVDKSKRHDVVAAKLAEKETELTNLAKAAKTKEITAMLDTALSAKKITAQQKDIFAKQYAENGDGLAEILASMGAYQSVSHGLNTQERSTGGKNMAPEVKAMFDKGFTALHKSGDLAKLKTMDPEAYTDLYESHFGYKPNAKPAPKAPAKK